MAGNNQPSENIELKWVQNPQFSPLSLSEKAVIKFKENPFVFGGTLATIAALSLGLQSLYKGDGKRQQKMMRFRVLAQGFTIAAVVVGLLLSEFNKKDEKKIN